MSKKDNTKNFKHISDMVGNDDIYNLSIDIRCHLITNYNRTNARTQYFAVGFVFIIATSMIAYISAFAV